MVKSFSPKDARLTQLETSHAPALEQQKNPPAGKAPVSLPSLQASDTDQFESVSTPTSRLSIPLSAVPKVPYVSADALKSQLQPGDIFLSYYPKSTDAIAFGIRRGQQAMTKITGHEPAKKSYNFVHAGIYIGDGKVSEAVGEGIKANAIEGERFKLKPGDKHSFLVVRPRNTLMAEEAAKIAESVSKEDSVPLKYSIKKAFMAGLTTPDDQLNEKGLMRYLKGAAYAHSYHTGDAPPPLSKNGVREFFCSQFVGWACQAGESLDVIKRINDGLPADEQITFPDLSQIPEKKQAAVLDKWAKDTVRRNKDVLSQEIDVDFDPKLMTPQHFYEYIVDHPELFEQKMAIVSPPSED